MVIILKIQEIGYKYHDSECHSRMKQSYRLDIKTDGISKHLIRTFQTFLFMVISFTILNWLCIWMIVNLEVQFLHFVVCGFNHHRLVHLISEMVKRDFMD